MRQASITMEHTGDRRIEHAAETLLILSREHGGPGGTAHRSGRVEVCEANTGSSQRVDVRRLIDGTAETTNITVAQVIGDDEDEVRFASTAMFRTEETDGEQA
jgi:hypothetical protein